VLYGLGLFTSSFVPSIPYMYLTFGVIFAIGESLCFSASLLILPEYFTRNWSLAHGIALCGNSMGALALAPILEVVLTKYGFKRGFQLASAASLYLMLASFFYKRPLKSQTNQQNVTAEKKNDEDEKPPLPLKKNKAFITFIIATTLMHFGYYIPFVHLIRMAMDLGVSRTNAALLPGYMALAQSAGKVILGKIATFPRVDKVIMYQIALLANCLATTTCPTITTYGGLIAYAVVFGLQDGCTSANNMLVVGDLVSKKQLSAGYSIFLVTSAASFLLGPPVAGLLYDTTGTYSLAFFFSGGTAALAICVLFQVPIFKTMQGRSDAMPSLLKKKSSGDEGDGAIDTKPSCSSKSDSGISLQYKDNMKTLNQDQSEEYIHMTVEKPGCKKQLHSVLNSDMDVLIVKDEDYRKNGSSINREKLAHCNSELALVVRQKDLEEFMTEPETTI